MTAIDRDGDQSAFSNEITFQAVDDGHGPRVKVNPPPPQIVLDPLCVGDYGCTLRGAHVTTGETGVSMDLSWASAEDGPYEVEIFKFPDGGDTPVFRIASTSLNVMPWTPSRAGLYYVEVTGASTKTVIPYLLYVKLAAPDPGGID